MSNVRKSFRELENEKTRGRKRYLERIQEEKEAKVEQERAMDELIRDSEENKYYNLRKE